MLDLNEIKDRYPQPENTTYLNTSSSALVSQLSIDEAHHFNERLQMFGSKQA